MVKDIDSVVDIQIVFGEEAMGVAIQGLIELLEVRGEPGRSLLLTALETCSQKIASGGRLVQSVSTLQ